MPEKKIRLIEVDPWLEPSKKDIEDRMERFDHRLRTIKREFGSLQEFAEGYQYFGLHYSSYRKGWHYREWAPQAHALFLTGDFNNWQKYQYPLRKNDFGVWEIFIPDGLSDRSIKHKDKIKVIVQSEIGEQYKIPAYIKRAVQDENDKSFTGQVWNSGDFNWKNDDFQLDHEKQLFIYECHVGMAQEKEGVGSFKEFTENILPRVKKAGYNTIQMMAIQEHPYYGSFGYHVSNFFAPSSRFGTPEDLKELIRIAHTMGIAVILDIVHSHTVKNTGEGINQFDGSENQYFHAGSRGEHPEWDSKIFDYGKTEVLRFLLSNLKYWLNEFHFDGFRFDGVGSMMYFHHGLEQIDSQEKYFRQGVEWDAITYLQLANELVHSVKSNAVTIAEDVSGMPGLTFPSSEGGLGFDYRLGMGIPDFWIKLMKEQQDEDWNIHEMWQVLNDRIPYVKTVCYAESHDQALVGDKSIAFRLMDKEMYWHMHKDDPNLIIDRGMALHKLIRMFTISLGGQAYMNFMGNEFGHPEWIDFPREGNDWSYYYCRRQWKLADDPELKFQYLNSFDRNMLKVIEENNIMESLFAQQLNMDEGNKIIAFERNHLIFLFNFHPSNAIADYQFRVPKAGSYKLILNSDAEKFGGHGRIDESLEYITQQKDGDHFLSVYSTNRTCLVFKRIV